MSATIQNIAFDCCPWMRERNQMNVGNVALGGPFYCKYLVNDDKKGLS